MAAKETKTKTETKELEIKEGTVNVAKLNIRKKASIEADIVTIINKDDVIRIKSTKGNWHSIELADGTKGFCMKEFITVK